MASGLPAGYAVPKPQLLRVVGILDLVFASLLLLAGLAEAAMLVAMPWFLDYAQAEAGAQQEREKAERREKLADLLAREKAAKTPEEAAQAARERQQLESEPVVEVSDLRDLMGLTRDRRVQGYDLAKLLTGLLLNGFMLAAGIALVRVSERGRRLGIWAAALKVARLALIATVAVLWIIPIKVQATRAVMAKLEQQTSAGQPGRSDVNTMAVMSGVSETVSVLAYLVFGSIWPVIAIVILTRPGARAAGVASATTRPAEPVKVAGGGDEL